MGLVFHRLICHTNQPNVGKYTMHGSYEYRKTTVVGRVLAIIMTFIMPQPQPVIYESTRCCCSSTTIDKWAIAKTLT